MKWQPLERIKKGRPKIAWITGQIQNVMTDTYFPSGDWKDRP